ncbi:class I SAM-dependent methyltransferase [Candidatus Parcubacteria bacterium]|nr:class I SAM-dependent methyltransferase [Candidatus Parcubacteria bacterium]
MFKQPEEKINNFYLEQISNNEVEKFGDLKQLIIDDKLPKIDGKINVLELGVGGGETMKKLKDQLHSRDDINVIGFDGAFMFSDNFKRATDSEAVAADAGLIPINDNSLSAVNASAILHEISSYGASTEDGGKVFGPEAIKKSLNEIKRCLAESGVLTYRDVACPKDRLKTKTVSYSRKSWKMFLNMYLPVLQDASKEVSPEIFNGYKLEEDVDNTRIRATAQAQREIQRHYITFRDYFRKKIFPEMGIRVIKEDWTEKSKGNKQHSIELSGVALRYYINKMNPTEQTLGIKNMSLTMSSDEYDDFTDEIMELGFNEDVSDFHEEWFRREGREIYTYLEPEEIKQMVAEPDTDGSVLIAEKEKMAPRYYYQRYLDRVIKNPEFEGKQIINFIKKTYDKQT